MGSYFSTPQSDPDLVLLETQAIINALPSSHWAVPATNFARFMPLPGEIRKLIIAQYLHLEREIGALSKRCHLTGYHRRCCVWDYPEVLVICDDQDPSTYPGKRRFGPGYIFPEGSSGRLPLGFLPALAFASKAMLGEVTHHMVMNTERFDLWSGYYPSKLDIATWFHEVITAIPGVLNSVTHLGFSCDMSAQRVELMLACPNLKKVDMTIHAIALWEYDPFYESRSEVHELVDRFHLKEMLGCKQLREVYIDGIYDQLSGAGSYDLDKLEGLGKWMIKEFRARGQKVQVEFVRRPGPLSFQPWQGRLPGTILELEDEE